MTDQEQKSRFSDEIAGSAAKTTVQREKGYEWIELMPIAFGGWCYYLRQDYTEVEGLFLPDTAKDRSQFATVLGIGPRVGMKPTKVDVERYGLPDGQATVSGVKVGDRVFLTQQRGEFSELVKRSPFNWEAELFVHESFPVAIVED